MKTHLYILDHLILKKPLAGSKFQSEQFFRHAATPKKKHRPPTKQNKTPKKIKHLYQLESRGLSWPLTNPPFGGCAIYFHYGVGVFVGPSWLDFRGWKKISAKLRFSSKEPTEFDEGVIVGFLDQNKQRCQPWILGGFLMQNNICKSTRILDAKKNICKAIHNCNTPKKWRNVPYKKGPFQKERIVSQTLFFRGHGSFLGGVCFWVAFILEENPRSKVVTEGGG